MSSAPTNTVDARALLGRTVKGRYRLISVIGEGGMGAVFAAEHLEIGRRVAVKLVHAVHARNPQIVGRLKQEARATGAIESDHVVQILDAGEDEALGLFVVMELLTGEDLERRLERDKRIPEAEAIWIADQAARGLARAHARGVIHRDLKPANVFLSVREDAPSPIVKMVDFGIAKLVRDASAGGHRALTQSGMVVGTAQYMSPEQAQGFEIDERTDVYSLGALIYEMIVGEPPVPDLESYEQKILHIVTKPRPRISDSVPTVSPELDRLVSEMLAMDREARPRDMTAVRHRLAALIPGRSAVSEPPPPPTVTSVSAVDEFALPTLFTRRSDARRLAWGAAVIVGVAMAVFGVRAAAARSVAAGQALVPRSITTPTVLVATGLETTEPRPRAARVQSPHPIPRWTPPPPQIPTARPLGGTGISQEF